MKYKGSKSRFADEITTILRAERKTGQWFVDMFCGACSIVERMQNKRIANDLSTNIYALMTAIQIGWIPPAIVTYQEYIHAKEFPTPAYLKGFIGFGCTWGGKYFDGYASDGKGIRNYADESRRSLLAQRDKLSRIIFTNLDYRAVFLPPKSLIYCDPPYKDTSDYGGNFDHNVFWAWCDQKVKEGHTVFVSEYQAPVGWKCVWSKDTVNNLNNAATIEKLWSKHGSLNATS